MLKLGRVLVICHQPGCPQIGKSAGTMVARYSDPLGTMCRQDRKLGSFGKTSIIWLRAHRCARNVVLPRWCLARSAGQSCGVVPKT